MKLSQPKFITWLVAVILGIVGLILHLALATPGIIPLVVVLVGLGLLALGNAVKGL